MTTLTFDSLDYFEKLKDAGFTEKQAKVQASVLQTALNMHDETSRKELATRGDIQDVRNEIQDVRNELKDTKHEILKWMIATMVAQTALIVAVMAFLK